MKALYLTMFVLIGTSFFVLVVMWENITGMEGIASLVVRFGISILAMIALTPLIKRMYGIALKERDSGITKFKTIDNDVRNDL